MTRARCSRRAAAAAVIALLVTIACSVPHEYETRRYETPAEPDAASALQVSVRFTAGGVELRAAPDGSLYRAELSYCAIHTIPEVSETPADRDGRASLSISLGGRPGVFVGFGGERNELTLGLARNRPLDLDLNLGQGESVLDLSDMRLARVRILGGAGDTRVVFGGPNPEPAGEILIEGTIGDVSVDRLGNANAGIFRLIGGLGSLEVDLSGDWRRDARIMIEGAVGDVLLRVPRGGSFRLDVGEPWNEGLAPPGFVKRDGAFYSPDYGGGGPRVDITLEAGIGELILEEIER